MNTMIHYLCRDADNYKNHQSVVIAGDMTDEQEQTIRFCLKGGEYFIPDKVGLPGDRFGAVTEADHPWFEWNGYEPTAAPPTLHITVTELIERFEKASWPSDCK